MFSYEIVICSSRGYYSLGEGNMCCNRCVQSAAVGGKQIGAFRVLPLVAKRYIGKSNYWLKKKNMERLLTFYASQQ